MFHSDGRSPRLANTTGRHLLPCSWDKTAPRPWWLASISKMKDLLKSAKARTGALVRAVLRAWKAFLHELVHLAPKLIVGRLFFCPLIISALAYSRGQQSVNFFNKPPVITSETKKGSKFLKILWLVPPGYS